MMKYFCYCVCHPGLWAEKRFLRGEENYTVFFFFLSQVVPVFDDYSL